MSSTITPTGTIPPGWYDDPSSTHHLRWWDGFQWTAHTSAKFVQPVVEQSAYRPFATLPPVLGGPYARLFGSPSTLGVWLLAFLPVMWLVSTFVIGIAVGYLRIPEIYPTQLLNLIVLVPAWIFAALDVRALRQRGYVPASIWWMLLLPPLVYLIARGRVVRAAGQRAWPPELAYFLSIVAIVTINVVLALGMRAALAPSPGGVSSGPLSSGAGTSGATNSPDTSLLIPLGSVHKSGAALVPEVQDLMAAYRYEGLPSTGLCGSGSGIAVGSSFQCTLDNQIDSALVDLSIDANGALTMVVPNRPPDNRGGPGVANGILVVQAESAGSLPDSNAPWEAQIESVIAQRAQLSSVDCSASLQVMASPSTFPCVGVRAGSPVQLSVTMSPVGNVGFTVD